MPSGSFLRPSTRALCMIQESIAKRQCNPESIAKDCAKPPYPYRSCLGIPTYPECETGNLIFANETYDKKTLRVFAYSTGFTLGIFFFFNKFHIEV